MKCISRSRLIGCGDVTSKFLLMKCSWILPVIFHYYVLGLIKIFVIIKLYFTPFVMVFSPLSPSPMKYIILNRNVFAHVWGSLRRRWWEGQWGSPWGGRWRRDPWRGELIRGWGRRTVAKTELWWSAVALWEALWWGEASRRCGHNVGGEGWGRGRGSSARRGWAIATNGLSCWHPHSLWAISLLPRWRGLARPAVGCTGRHAATPLAGSWLSWCLVFAVSRFSPFNLHFFAHDVVKMHVDSLVH